MPEQKAIAGGVEMLTQANSPLQSINEEDRTIECVFSTGQLVQHPVRHNDRWQYMQTRLVLTAEACDLTQAEKGVIPVLDNHYCYETQAILGNVQKITIGNNEARGVLKFSQADSVKDIWQKVSDGSLRQVSIGFEVMEQELRIEQNDKGEDIEVMHFTKWRPMEISMVAIGADRGAMTQAAALRQTEALSPNSAATVAEPASQPPAADGPLSSTQEEADMPENETQTAAEPAVTTQAAPAPQTQQSDNTQTQAAVVAERGRIAGIQRTGAQLGTSAELIQQAIDKGTSLDDFRATAIEAFAEAGQTQTQGIGGPRATVTADGQDRFRQGALLGLMGRAGMEGGERNEFTGQTLSELARQSLHVSNATIPMDRTQMVGAAFTQSGAHGTSDFSNVLINLMGKAALKGWESAEETYELWTNEGVLTDFKPSRRVGLGLMDALPEVKEGANYKFGTVGDRGETITLATYGRMLRITRQAIINDDLMLFTKLPADMARAAKRTIGNLVYAVLTSNPNMSDGTALFHADHNNLAASGAAPSVTTLSAARTAMMTQKEKADGDALNIRPAYFIVPAALETSATELMNNVVNPEAQKGHARNPIANMAQVVADARLDAHSATAWYLAAGKSFDTIEVAYLDGNKTPFIEEQAGWSSDGVEVKVRMDAGVAPLEYRTLYKNAGA
jgi:phage head maturation protease